MWTAASWRKTEAATERLGGFICLRVCVSSRLSSSWFGAFYASSQIETSAGGTQSTSPPPWKPPRHPSFSCPVTETVFFCQMRKSRSINRNSCQERAGGVCWRSCIVASDETLVSYKCQLFQGLMNTRQTTVKHAWSTCHVGPFVQVSRGIFGAQVQRGETSVMLPVRQTLRYCLCQKIVKTSWRPLLIFGFGKWKWPYLDKRADILIGSDPEPEDTSWSTSTTQVRNRVIFS